MTPEELKHSLMQGDLKRLSDRFGIHPSTASKVLHGKSKNVDFLEAIIQQAIENQSRIRSGFEKLKSIQ